MTSWTFTLVEDLELTDAGRVFLIILLGLSIYIGDLLPKGKWGVLTSMGY